jgi:hypothetical protein
VELVDTPDSKSGASNSVPVQVRPPVPLNDGRFPVRAKPDWKSLCRN